MISGGPLGGGDHWVKHEGGKYLAWVEGEKHYVVVQAEERVGKVGAGGRHH